MLLFKVIEVPWEFFTLPFTALGSILSELLSQPLLSFIFTELIDGKHKVILDVSKHYSSSFKAKEIWKIFLDVFDKVTLRSLGADLACQPDSFDHLLLHLDLCLDSYNALKLEFDYGSDDASNLFIDETETRVHLLLEDSFLHDVLLLAFALENIMSLIGGYFFQLVY